MSNHEAGIQFILAEIMAVIFSTQAELVGFCFKNYRFHAPIAPLLHGDKDFTQHRKADKKLP